MLKNRVKIRVDLHSGSGYSDTGFRYGFSIPRYGFFFQRQVFNY